MTIINLILQENLSHSGLPYGEAPWWCYPVAEASMFVLFLCCLIHASRKGAREVAYLIGGLVFGVLLEYMEVYLGRYSYGRFELMVGRAPNEVPLCIGAGWGIIMYAGRLYTDHIKLPLWSAAALDTLLALNIDLSLDVVAYRTHMWHWDWSHTTLDPLKAQWFGIPFGNFVGWITVVFCYSAFSRLLEQAFKQKKIGNVKFFLTGLLSVILSITVLFLSEVAFQWLKRNFQISSGLRFGIFSALLVRLVVLGWNKKSCPKCKLPVLTWCVPAWFHLYFGVCFLVLGFYKESVLMSAVTALNLLIGIAIHVHMITMFRQKT